MMLQFENKISSSTKLFINRPIAVFFIFCLPLIFSFVNCSSSQKSLKKAAAAVPPPEQQAVTAGELSLGKMLPTGPAVEIGILPNGLKYYIRQNRKPENRAELRLVVKAGSILEDDDQQGLAHFVEHMAFNGTKKYQKQELLDKLESFGMRLGPDVNAHTGFDETSYELHIPTDSLELLETGIGILREWATNIAFNPEEIDKERGIILEERRYRRTPQMRIFEAQLPVLFKDSRYAIRLPIGTVDNLKNFDYNTIKRFYHDWYRPELMAVIVVGDFDPQTAKELIQKNFNDIPATKNGRPRVIYDIPENQKPLFAIASDPEVTTGQIGVMYKHDKIPEKTVGDYRRFVVNNLYYGIFNSRLQELTQSSDPPFISAFSGSATLGLTKDTYNLLAIVRGDAFDRALESLLLEAKRVKEFGFTPGELARQKQEYLRMMEQAFSEKDKTNSASYASELVRNYLEDEPIPGIERELEMVKTFLPTILLEEVNQVGGHWITTENRIVSESGPQKEGFHLPDSSELLSVFQKVEAEEVEPYRENVSAAPLISEELAPTKIVRESLLDSIGVTRWALSNGVSVVLKPTDFKNDEILMLAYSPGGTSLVPDSLFIDAEFAASLVRQGGLGDFGPIELQKKLQGKMVNVSPSIDELSEGLSGSAAPGDLETLFQLTYLYFTRPRADSTAFISFKKRLQDFLKNRAVNPDAVFADTIAVTMSRHHFRKQPLNEKQLKQLRLEKAFRVYHRRFAEAGDFTFYFVGNFEPETIKPFVLRYLGNLPTRHRVEKWRDVGIRPPTGRIEKVVRKGIEPRSAVRIIFTGPFEWKQTNRRKIQAMADVLGLKLREVIREEMEGTYTIAARAATSQFPVPEYRLTIQFNCDPQRSEELVHTILQQIDSLKTVAADEKYVIKVKEKWLRDYEENVKTNRYWAQLLQFYEVHRENPNSIIRGPKAFVGKLTPATIREAAQQYLDQKNMAIFILLPENMKSEE